MPSSKSHRSLSVAGLCRDASIDKSCGQSPESFEGKVALISAHDLGCLERPRNDMTHDHRRASSGSSPGVNSKKPAISRGRARDWTPPPNRLIETLAPGASRPMTSPLYKWAALRIPRKRRPANTEGQQGCRSGFVVADIRTTHSRIRLLQGTEMPKRRGIPRTSPAPPLLSGRNGGWPRFKGPQPMPWPPTEFSHRASAVSSPPRPAGRAAAMRSSMSGRVCVVALLRQNTRARFRKMTRPTGR